MITHDMKKMAYVAQTGHIIMKEIDGGWTILGNKHSEGANFNFSKDGRILWVRDSYTIRM